MTQGYSNAQLEQFKREAKILRRKQSIPHSHALDLIAQREGFPNWSLLAKHATTTTDASPAVIAPGGSRPVSTRRYLHGDQFEIDPSLYYCARCDIFLPESHFTDSNVHTLERHAERFLSDYARWMELRLELPSRHRPDSTPNLFAEDAFRGLAAHEACRSPFHRWLTEQAYRDDPVGDLARDVRSDKAFPVSAKTLRAAAEYLDGFGDHIASALREAWMDFRASKRPPA